MKKILLSLILISFFGVSLSAQIGEVLTLSSNAFELHGLKASHDDSALGSPFIQGSFLPSSIKGYDSKMEMRYNAFSDEVEFLLDKEIYTLDKHKYPEVQIGPNELNYVYLYSTYIEGKNIVKGFLRRISENDFSTIFVKEKVSFTPAQKSTNGYTAVKPAAYKRLKDKYFIQLNNSIQELPTNAKKVSQLFEGKEKQVSDFINAQKINVTVEADLIRLNSFLGSL